MYYCTLKIEYPVLGLILHDGLFYDQWKPDQKYWCGHRVKVPMPYQFLNNKG